MTDLTELAPDNAAPAISCMGVLAHPLRSTTYPIAQWITDGLRARGVQAWLHTDWHAEQIVDDVRRADMVIAIGGDGAMLRAARVCAAVNVPVLGINMGQLGFLTEINQPEDWEASLEAVLRGEYWIEQRMMLHAAVRREGEVVTASEALNDIVISGSVIGRMVHLDTYIDDHWATTYSADALVIATATGSTAYALACGGPILPPELSNILIIPAAPHLSMDRPIVLSEGAHVEVKPSTTNRNDVVFSADGVVLHTLAAGDSVSIQASDDVSRFVRLRSRNYFYRSLLDRLEPRVSRGGVQR